jgi:hypothetical protein
MDTATIVDAGAAQVYEIENDFLKYLVTTLGCCKQFLS